MTDVYVEPLLIVHFLFVALRTPVIGCVQATVTQTGCESYTCPTGSGTATATTASGTFTDSYGTTFTAATSGTSIVLSEKTGTDKATSCAGTFSVTSGTVLGVSA